VTMCPGVFSNCVCCEFQDDVMLPQRISLQYQAALLWPHAVRSSSSSSYLLLSLFCVCVCVCTCVRVCVHVCVCTCVCRAEQENVSGVEALLVGCQVRGEGSWVCGRLECGRPETAGLLPTINNPPYSADRVVFTLFHRGDPLFSFDTIVCFSSCVHL